jgi:hypothetical protein
VKKGRRVERKLFGRLKASIPCLYAKSNALYDYRQFVTFSSDSVDLKKSSGGLNGLIGPPLSMPWDSLAAGARKNIRYRQRTQSDFSYKFSKIHRKKRTRICCMLHGYGLRVYGEKPQRIMVKKRLKRFYLATRKRLRLVLKNLVFDRVLLIS